MHTLDKSNCGKVIENCYRLDNTYLYECQTCNDTYQQTEDYELCGESIENCK